MRSGRRVAALLTALAIAVGTAGCAPARPFFARTVSSGVQVSAGFAPFVIDADGDGWDDIWWYHPTGQDRIWWGRADGAFVHGVAPAQVQGIRTGVVGDFGGDAAEDVLLYSHEAPSTLVITTAGGGVASTRNIDLPRSMEAMVIDEASSRDGVLLRSSEAGTAVTWDPDRGDDMIVPIGNDGIPLPGDFDGDGDGDVFFYRVGPIADVVSWGDGEGGFQDQTVRNITGSYFSSVMDADGDGRDDLVFHTDPMQTGSADLHLWYGGADRTWRRESRESFCCRGPAFVFRSHSGGRDTLVQTSNSGLQSWTIDTGGVTRIGEPQRTPAPVYSDPLVGRFHDGVADDLFHYDEFDEYPEFLVLTPNRA